MFQRARQLFAPVVLAIGRVRQLFAADPAAPPMFGSAGLRAYLGGQTKIAAEIKSVLGAFKPRLIGLRERLMMRDDPDVALALVILRAPIINLQWSIESEDDELAAFAETALRPLYNQLAVGGSLAIHFGNQVLGKDYEVVDSFEVKQTGDAGGGASTKKTYQNALLFRRFKTIDPTTISLLIDRDLDDWGGVEQQQGTGEPVRVGRDGAVLWAYRRQEVWGKLRGYPQSDQAYDQWYAKHALRFCRNRYMENRADPPWKGWADAELDKGGAKIDGFQYMHDQLTNVKGGGSILLPNVFDDRGNRKFDAELVASEKRGDMFQQAIDAESTQILRAYWITDKAGTSDGSGSLAMAQVHAETMALGVQGALNEWIEILNTQVLTPLLELNFGVERAKAAQARFVGAGISADMKALYKDLLLQLLQVEQLQADGKSVSLHDRIDSTALAQQLGVPLRSEDDAKAMGGDRSSLTPEENAAGVLTGKQGDPPAGAPQVDANGMPVGSQDVQVTQDAVLNGAQIAAAVDIVAKVVTGEIPGDAALGMLEVLFNLTTEQAKQILGSAKAAKKDPGPPPATPPRTGMPGAPDMPPMAGGPPGVPGAAVSGA